MYIVAVYARVYMYMIKMNNSTRLRKPFSKEKLAASGGIGTHDTLLSRPSTLPTKLLYNVNSVK